MPAPPRRASGRRRGPHRAGRGRRRLDDTKVDPQPGPHDGAARSRIWWVIGRAVPTSGELELRLQRLRRLGCWRLLLAPTRASCSSDFVHAFFAVAELGGVLVVNLAEQHDVLGRADPALASI